MSNFIYTIECYLLIQSIKSSFIIFKKYKGVQFRTTFIYIYIYIFRYIRTTYIYNDYDGYIIKYIDRIHEIPIQ